MKTVVISGTGLFTPGESISNDELVSTFNEFVESSNDKNQEAIASGKVEALQPSSSEFIVKASGIKSRYVMNKSGILDPEIMAPRIPERSNDELSILSEMAVHAAKQALKNSGKTAKDIDAIYVACSNMQRSYPAMAIEVQDALGVEGFAYDLNVACSSATFGIQAAYNALVAGSAKTVLVVNPEICTAHLNFRDRDSHFIFGDACTAIVLEGKDTCTSKNAYKILDCVLTTKFSNNIRNNAGFLNRTHPETRDNDDKLFKQEGRKVFKEVVPMVAKLITTQLEKLTINPDDLKRMWLHQANLSMNQLIAHKVLGRTPTEKEAPVILDEYANTSSAGSIIDFHKYNEDLVSGDKGVICSFGAGYSAGSIVIEKV